MSTSPEHVKRLAGEHTKRLAGEPTNGLAGEHTNRLAGETSPYLLQHAHNPVDWYPWGEEALAQAASDRADLPVDRLRRLPLVPCDGAGVVRGSSRRRPTSNEQFVAIKVDREERPDIDASTWRRSRR